MIPRSDSPKARAALRVVPASASVGVKRNKVQAMFIASNTDPKGDDPGFQSVATAMGNYTKKTGARKRLGEDVVHDGASRAKKSRSAAAVPDF